MSDYDRDFDNDILERIANNLPQEVITHVAFHYDFNQTILPAIETELMRFHNTCNCFGCNLIESDIRWLIHLVLEDSNNWRIPSFIRVIMDGLHYERHRRLISYILWFLDYNDVEYEI